MSTNDYRKCSKCGIKRFDDTSVSYHRFPKPAMRNITKARAWAQYVWPDKDWTVESLTSLHSQNKVICGRHFHTNHFYDSQRQKLSIFAVPGSSGMMKTESAIPNINDKVETKIVEKDVDVDKEAKNNVIKMNSEDSEKRNSDKININLEKEESLTVKVLNVEGEKINNVKRMISWENRETNTDIKIINMENEGSNTVEKIIPVEKEAKTVVKVINVNKEINVEKKESNRLTSVQKVVYVQNEKRRINTVNKIMKLDEKKSKSVKKVMSVDKVFQLWLRNKSKEMDIDSLPKAGKDSPVSSTKSSLESDVMYVIDDDDVDESFVERLDEDILNDEELYLNEQKNVDKTSVQILDEDILNDEELYLDEHKNIDKTTVQILDEDILNDIELYLDEQNNIDKTTVQILDEDILNDEELYLDEHKNIDKTTVQILDEDILNDEEIYLDEQNNIDKTTVQILDEDVLNDETYYLQRLKEDLIDYLEVDKQKANDNNSDNADEPSVELLHEDKLLDLKYYTDHPESEGLILIDEKDFDNLKDLLNDQIFVEILDENEQSNETCIENHVFEANVDNSDKDILENDISEKNILIAESCDKLLEGNICFNKSNEENLDNNIIIKKTKVKHPESISKERKNVNLERLLSTDKTKSNIRNMDEDILNNKKILHIEREVWRDETYDVSKLCRACLSIEKTKPIPDNLTDMFLEIIGLLNEDCFPKLVCDECIDKLKEFNEFRNQCLQSKRWLMDKINTTSQLNKPENTYEKINAIDVTNDVVTGDKDLESENTVSPINDNIAACIEITDTGIVNINTSDSKITEPNSSINNNIGDETEIAKKKKIIVRVLDKDSNTLMPVPSDIVPKDIKEYIDKMKNRLLLLSNYKPKLSLSSQLSYKRDSLQKDKVEKVNVHAPFLKDKVEKVNVQAPLQKDKVEKVNVQAPFQKDKVEKVNVQAPFLKDKDEKVNVPIQKNKVRKRIKPKPKPVVDFSDESDTNCDATARTRKRRKI